MCIAAVKGLWLSVNHIRFLKIISTEGKRQMQTRLIMNFIGINNEFCLFALY